MDTSVYLDHYLTLKGRQRRSVFEDAASSSLLMSGVVFLYRHSQFVFDQYCRCFMALRLWQNRPRDADAVWRDLDRHHADAIDTYHLAWVGVIVACYAVGWQLYGRLESDTTFAWLCWTAPIAVCAYRMFDISAAFIEIYFGNSDSRHHQFRILLHAGMHFIGIALAFALFYIFADWGWGSFSTTGDDDETVYQFEEWFDSIYASLLTILFWGGPEEPQDWLGKILVLLEVLIGFVLATFIFLNITQIWVGDKRDR